jgi:hypothetical protein
MPVAVVTGGAVSPGEGVALGVMLGSAAGTGGSGDPAGAAGASVTAADTATMPESAIPIAVMKLRS